jgi:hypothetical protein
MLRISRHRVSGRHKTPTAGPTHLSMVARAECKRPPTEAAFYMNAITNPIATRASTPVMAMPRYRPPMTSDWNLGCLPGTALLHAISHHEHKPETVNRSRELHNLTSCSWRGSLCSNATLFLLSLDDGTETTAPPERRTRAGHRSLKQGQLEVVGRGRPLKDGRAAPP